MRAPEEKVDRLVSAVRGHPLMREILYKTLRLCRGEAPKPLGEIEDAIAAFPEFPAAHQSQYHLVQMLVRAEGLDELELDSDGALVTQARKEGLSEDEVDDLVASLAYKTTDIGDVVVEGFSPAHRFERLLKETPEYRDAYIEVLGFLREKKSFADVDALFRGRDVLMARRAPDERPAQPSVLIDKLETAGAIVWSDGWQTTEDGLEILKAFDPDKDDMEA